MNLSAVETIERAEEIILEYRMKAESATPEQLLKWQDELAALNVTVGDVLSDLKKHYYDSQYSEEIEELNLKMKYIRAEKLSYNEANAQAKKNNKTKGQKARDEKILWYKVDQKEKHIRGVLSAMQQRISYVKEEKSRTMTTSNMLKSVNEILAYMREEIRRAK
jgi:type II secretory pathway component HofQ